MGLPQGSEWIIILLIVVLLFGAKKLPDTARGLGRSLRIFKSEVKQTDEPVEPVSGATAVTPAAIVQAPVQPQVQPQPVQSQPVQTQPAQAYVPVAPAAPQTYVPVQPAPVAESVPMHDDPTSVQSVNERFYGQERSDR